ncbi:hypothetical protein P3T76_005667 [Phytophthora citrophthora]|uniref:Tudor-knot domain-containing protein n=1 Tax=Phytophthora citrophthora TaxID=4793 RepID=A0AAD9GQV6_9STRA|nr:hypothetical protein P3T76_005667 [Phytophthora citrophthora]
MYVTRRLLRSTLPPESEKEKETSFLPSTPRRRAAVRACAKIDEIADVSGPAVRNKAVKTSENAGDEKNKRNHQKKMKKKEEKQKKNEEAPALDVSSLHGYQLMVDVHYRGEQYTEARILDLDPEKQLLFVHYMGWNSRFDAWVPAEELAAHGSHTNVAKKKDVSWDGDTPLFITEEELVVHRQGGKIKPRKAMKKRTVLSPKAQKAARKALQSVNTEVEEQEAQPVKRVGRKSPKPSKKHTTKSPRAGKKAPKTTASPARRTPRRVQVAVGTTDEDSERQNDSEAADLVLDVEIEGHEASNDEPEEEGAEREEEEYEEATPSRKSRKNQRKESPGGSKRKRDLSHDEEEESDARKRSPVNKKKPKNMPSTPAKTAPLPPRSGRGGLGSTTREKLAAIFRQRIQEREQLQQLNGSQTSFQQTLQDPAVEPSAAHAMSNAAEETEAKNIAMVNPEVAAAEEYQRQLQQYYYHQQLMLANSLHMNATGSEDPSTFPLQGGIMDPRIIQERLTALEERRRQQAHVQAYYQQLMLTRERNVRALAANQAFMAASAAVWEQQLKETQSEDGTSSVASWKDVKDADASETSKTDKTTAAPSSEADESSKSDSESVKESEMSAAAAVASPDTVEKTAERCTSAKTSPTKSVSDKCDPEDPPAQGVLYEFVL